MSATSVLLCSSYKDIDGLDRLLSESVQEFFDKIVIIEGRYEGYPKPDIYDPYQISDRFTTKKIHVKVMDGYPQIDKRNAYLHESYGFDFGVIVDTDEFLEINPDVFRAELDRLKSSKDRVFPIEFINLGVRMQGPRLLRNPSSLHYQQNTDPNTISHGQIFDADGNEVVRGIWNFHGIRKGEYVKGIRLYHDKEKRDMRRIIEDLKYQQTVPNR